MDCGCNREANAVTHISGGSAEKSEAHPPVRSYSRGFQEVYMRTAEDRWRSFVLAVVGWDKVLQKAVDAPQWFGEYDIARNLDKWIGYHVEERIQSYMAGRPKSNNQKPTWKGYREVRVGAEDVAAFTKAGTDHVEMLEKLANLTAAGYKVSVSYDKGNDCAIVSLTCNDRNSPDAGYTMTSRGPDVERALAFALYKHFELCGGVWVEDGEEDTALYR